MKGYGLDGELARLDLGEVEYVVDDAEQRSTRVVDLRDVVTLLGVQRGLQRKVGHSDDRIHRRTDLVAHVGEEIAFRASCVFRNFLRALHGELCCLALGDVLEPAEQPLLTLDLDRQVGDEHGALTPLPVIHRHFLVPCNAVERQTLDDGFPILLVYVDLRRRVTDADTERLAEAGIGEADHALGGKRDVDRTRIEDLLQSRALFAERYCSGMLFRDIPYPARDQRFTVDRDE
ncbi:hypothetical protein D3C80_1306320 [compost metagenome]